MVYRYRVIYTLSVVALCINVYYVYIYQCQTIHHHHISDTRTENVSLVVNDSVENSKSQKGAIDCSLLFIVFL